MITPEAKESIGQAIDGCLDVLRRYTPSTTSGNPPLPDPQVLRNVINTLEDTIDALEPYEEETTESDEVPDVVDPDPGFSGVWRKKESP